MSFVFTLSAGRLTKEAITPAQNDDLINYIYNIHAFCGICIWVVSIVS